MTSGPFGTGFATADYTQEINMIPNTFGRIQQMGLFGASEGVDTDMVVIDKVGQTLSVLAAKERGAPADRQNPETRETVLFQIPHFRIEDYITPMDVRARRAPGSQQLDSIDRVRLKKTNTLRATHAQTMEFLRMGALKGKIIDGAGVELIDLYAEFGITEKAVDFKLGTDTTDVQKKAMEVKRHIELNVANGQVIDNFHSFVDPDFFDGLIGHPKVREAYQHYTSAPDPLRNDARRRFPWMGIVWEEYNASVKGATGQTIKFVPTKEARVFPTGVQDMFANYFPPANHIEHVNTLGQEMYLFETTDPEGRWIKLDSESNALPICRRPGALVRCHSTT